MIPVNTPVLNGNEEKYLLECIRTGWISSEGPFVRQFENLFSSYIGRAHGIAVSNGSAALDVAVRALDLPPGSEVLVPTFTIISPVQSLVNEGLVPVLVDSDSVTWNMDVATLEEKITPKTKAILVVHIYGLPVDMATVELLAAKHGLMIIEDAAEMHGQTYKGQKCGSFGKISTFSFYPNKHITTGEGGMILTDDEALAERCRALRNLCFVPERRFVHHELGWNYRMTNLQAALGVAQLENIDQIIEKKRAIGQLYLKKLSGVERLQLPLESTPYAENIFWVFGMVADSQKLAEKIVAHLTSKKIGTRPFFWCMHQQPVFNNRGLFLDQHFPKAEHMATNGFYVPSGLGITEDQIAYVCEQILEILDDE